MHSTTKYLGGHSDVVGGAWWSPTQSSPTARLHPERDRRVPGPFDSWLTLRGIRTLAARMDRHGKNAMRVAQMLTSTRR